MNSVLMNLKEKDDEKALIDDVRRPLVPSTRNQNNIDADPDFDEDVMIDFPTNGGQLNSDQSLAPEHVDPANRPQDDGRTIAPVRPQREENDRIGTCCNIL